MKNSESDGAAISHARHATVVIRTRDCEQDLRVLLPLLAEQTDIALSTVIVDNESSDGTLALAHAFGATIVSIAREQFSWGRALNLGISAANDEAVILLSSDAFPTSDSWAQEMHDALMHTGIATIYGRQVPRHDAPVDECVRVLKKFSAVSHTWSEKTSQEDGAQRLIASNACAAIRKSVWAAKPFDEQCLGAEELPWASHVLKSGHSIRYISHVTVEHSHRETAQRQARRLWELYCEARRRSDHSIGLLDPARMTMSFVRIRIRNVLIAKRRFRQRAEGIVKLPLEAFVLFWLCTCSVLGDRDLGHHLKW